MSESRKARKKRKGLPLFCRRELRFSTFFKVVGTLRVPCPLFSCQNHGKYERRTARRSVPATVLSESRNARKGRKGRKIWKGVHLFCRRGMPTGIHTVDLNSDSRPSLYRNEPPIISNLRCLTIGFFVFSSVSSFSVFSVIQTDRRGHDGNTPLL